MRHRLMPRAYCTAIDSTYTVKCTFKIISSASLTLQAKEMYQKVTMQLMEERQQHATVIDEFKQVNIIALSCDHHSMIFVM